MARPSDGLPALLETQGFALGLPPAARERARIRAEAEWGRGMMLDMFAPGMAVDGPLRDTWSSYERHSASPGTAVAMLEVIWGSDIRHVLPTIGVPTLVITRGERIDHGRYLAAHIPGARLVELPGADSFMCAGAQEPIVSEIEAFVTGGETGPRSRPRARDGAVHGHRRVDGDGSPSRRPRVA